jgi:FkbM family methyltransferase
VNPEAALRAGRVTRHLPWLKGLGLLKHVYRAALSVPPGWKVRVDDFDGDLLLDVDPRETVGIHVWHKPELFEKAERQLFCSAISRGSVVLDVGANIGIYTLLAAKRGARVFAIEPDPNNVVMLRHHIKLNGFEDRVVIFEMAATEGQQSLVLYRDRTNCGHSNLFSGVDAVSVVGNTIDSLDLPPVDVCKMDIEGAEAQALHGMVGTIERSPRMHLLVEHSAQFGHTADLLDFVRSHFGTVYIAGKGELKTNETAPYFCNLWALKDSA